MGIMLNVHSIEPIRRRRIFFLPHKFPRKNFSQQFLDYSPYYLLQIISFIDKYHPS